MIGNIDEDGYLRATEEELSRQAGVSVERVHEIREKIKTFDPVGVGSLDLQGSAAGADGLSGDRRRRPPAGSSRTISTWSRNRISPSSPRSWGFPPRRQEPPRGDQAAGPGSRPESTARRGRPTWSPTSPSPRRTTSSSSGSTTRASPRLRISGYYRKLLAKAAKENAEASCLP